MRSLPEHCHQSQDETGRESREVGSAREEKMKAERKRSTAVLHEGRQTLGRVCGKIRRVGRILQASKAADEHVCRGAMKSTVVWRAESCGCFGPHWVLGLSGPVKDWFSGMPNIKLTWTRLPHFKQKPVYTH